MLFLAYVNDNTDILPSHCTSKLFVDDLKLYSVAHTCEDLLYRRVSRSFITGLKNGSLLSRIRSALLCQLVVQIVLIVLT